MAVCDLRKVNFVTAKVIPLFLLAVFGYATYVIVSPVCIQYLIRPDPVWNHQPRPGAAAAILTIYTILLVLLLAAFFRVNYAVMFDPGYVKHSELWYSHNPAANKRRQRKSKQKEQLARDVENADPLALAAAPPGLEDYTSRDVFVCGPDGRPIWCSHCLNYKPERTHHCSEVGRCVRKMDHFCPWVGGVVGETSYKFFFQFVTYAAILCVFVVVVVSIFFAEQKGVNVIPAQAHWIAILGLAAFFGLFTLGMCATGVNFLVHNLSNIENLDKKWKTWDLAIRLPEPHEIPPGTVAHPPQNAKWLRAITYQVPSKVSEKGSASSSTNTKSFVIMHAEQGENVWDTGNRLENVRSVMGNNILDWFLPIRQSPCVQHDRYEAHFPTGPAVERLKREAWEYGIWMLQSQQGQAPVPDSEVPLPQGTTFTSQPETEDQRQPAAAPISEQEPWSDPTSTSAVQQPEPAVGKPTSGEA